VANNVALTDQTIGILGGTGPQGMGLAYRFAAGGLRVVLGSRNAERAEEKAAELRGLLPDASISGLDNDGACTTADIVLIAVPWEAHEATVRAMAPHVTGKIVIDSVNPLGFDKQGPFPLDVEDGSAAQQAARLLPEARVTAAFHHVSAVVLSDPSVDDMELDVVVLGDDREATDVVCELAALMPGVRGIYGGRIRNAHQVEAFTANLIAINRRYKTPAGIRITGV
jgi:NADPH-dependent F420 reductase